MTLSKGLLLAAVPFLVGGVAAAQDQRQDLRDRMLLPDRMPQITVSDQGPTLRVIEERPLTFTEPNGLRFQRRGDSEPISRTEGMVDGAQVNAQLREMLASFSALFDDVADELDVALESIQLNFEVRADGQVGFLGTGVSAGSTGGITVTLRRPN